MKTTILDRKKCEKNTQTYTYAQILGRKGIYRRADNAGSERFIISSEQIERVPIYYDPPCSSSPIKATKSGQALSWENLRFVEVFEKITICFDNTKEE